MLMINLKNKSQQNSENIYLFDENGCCKWWSLNWLVFDGFWSIIDRVIERLIFIPSGHVNRKIYHFFALVRLKTGVSMCKCTVETLDFFHPSSGFQPYVRQQWACSASPKSHFMSQLEGMLQKQKKNTWKYKEIGLITKNRPNTNDPKELRKSRCFSLRLDDSGHFKWILWCLYKFMLPPWAISCLC